MHNSANCSICRGFPVGNSLSDKEFFGFVDACRNELEAKQENFRQRIAGCDRWFYDLADNSLTLGTFRFRITAVGTFSPKYETWLWTRTRITPRPLVKLRAAFSHSSPLPDFASSRLKQSKRHPQMHKIFLPWRSINSTRSDFSNVHLTGLHYTWQSMNNR